MAKIFLSLNSANLVCIEEEIKKFSPYCDGFHIDIMDNHFAPNIIFGPSIANAIDIITDQPIWVHLMVSDPLSIINKLTLKANSIISIHHESNGDKKEIIEQIIEKNWLPSMAINPESKIDCIVPYLQEIYQLLIMSVKPGFSGQEIIKKTIEKIEPLITYRKNNNTMQFRIGMDGGINQNNIATLKADGVQDFALDSAVFSAQNPLEALKKLHALLASCA